MHGYQKLTVMGLDGVTAFLTSLGFPMAGVYKTHRVERCVLLVAYV
jgi:uncharacterized membrane protein YphA (DoxX/SURF4 family)